MVFNNNALNDLITKSLKDISKRIPRLVSSINDIKNSEEEALTLPDSIASQKKRQKYFNEACDFLLKIESIQVLMNFQALMNQKLKAIEYLFEKLENEHCELIKEIINNQAQIQYLSDASLQYLVQLQEELINMIKMLKEDVRRIDEVIREFKNELKELEKDIIIRKQDLTNTLIHILDIDNNQPNVETIAIKIPRFDQEGIILEKENDVGTIKLVHDKNASKLKLQSLMNAAIETGHFIENKVIKQLTEYRLADIRTQLEQKLSTTTKTNPTVINNKIINIIQVEKLEDAAKNQAIEIINDMKQHTDFDSYMKKLAEVKSQIDRHVLISEKLEPAKQAREQINSQISDCVSMLDDVEHLCEHRINSIATPLDAALLDASLQKLTEKLSDDHKHVNDSQFGNTEITSETTGQAYSNHSVFNDDKKSSAENEALPDTRSDEDEDEKLRRPSFD
jgi:hypothetical protein